jgi:hypothetical protein
LEACYEQARGYTGWWYRWFSNRLQSKEDGLKPEDHGSLWQALLWFYTLLSALSVGLEEV